METLIFEYITEVTAPFLNPQKRVFVGYLALAVLIAVGVQVLVQGGGLGSTLSRLFSKRIWFSPSGLADIKILLINNALMMGIAPRLISKLAVATLLFNQLHIWLDGRIILGPDLPDWAVAGLFTVTVFLLDDLTKYLVHRALHEFPALWAFHRVHHTATTMTPLTVYRTHPVEAVIFSLRGIFVQAACIGGFFYFFGARVELVTVLGANLFLFVFNAAGSNLRHSHVWISYGPIIERILISPAQHQQHHGRDEHHHNRNYGAVLALWDWIGGSLLLAPKKSTIRFGVKGCNVSENTLFEVYVAPFLSAARSITPNLPRNNQKMKPRFSLIRSRFTAFWILVIALATIAGPAVAGELNIYSHRQPFLIKPFIEAYTEKTGTKINIVYASKGLAQRLQAEGSRSPADVILTVDIARLDVYADKDLLARVKSDVLHKNIPAHLRDPEGRWFAFSKRARVIAVTKSAPDTAEIKRYEDLADPKWKDRICSRPGSHVYNRALIASFIDAVGVEATEKWAAGVVSNLARRPQGNDRAQVKAIYEGVCDIAVINNYYFGKLKHSDKPAQRDWADSVNLIFPNQGDRGTHVNISGGGVAKHSTRKDEAVKFLEFLTTEAAQNLYGSINFEYPVNPAVAPSAELASWGQFKEDNMPIGRIAELAPEAQKIIDRVGW